MGGLAPLAGAAAAILAAVILAAEGWRASRVEEYGAAAQRLLASADLRQRERGVASMEQLTSVCSSFEARVLVARLYDEGIDAELRGALDSPYGFTVGDLARVDVFVPEDQAEAAQFVLLANAVDDATELPEPVWRARGVTWPCWVLLSM